jgi:hypothetical protein
MKQQEQNAEEKELTSAMSTEPAAAPADPQHRSQVQVAAEGREKGLWREREANLCDGGAAEGTGWEKPMSRVAVAGIQMRRIGRTRLIAG